MRFRVQGSVDSSDGGHLTVESKAITEPDLSLTYDKPAEKMDRGAAYRQRADRRHGIRGNGR